MATKKPGFFLKSETRLRIIYADVIDNDILDPKKEVIWTQNEV